MALNLHREEQHSRSQMQVRRQVVDHLLNLLAEEGTHHLVGGNRSAGKAASHLRGLETYLN